MVFINVVHVQKKPILLVYVQKNTVVPCPKTHGIIIVHVQKHGGICPKKHGITIVHVRKHDITIVHVQKTWWFGHVLKNMILL